jgi:DNA-binding transcriptional regulator YdaS (Cro superfamily)
MNRPQELEALKEAIAIAGNQTELARRITEARRASEPESAKVTQQHVWNWLMRDKKIPPECAPYIEIAVDGSVNRKDLCPTFPWDICAA